MKIDYIFIYDMDGSPIYTKCFGGFCKGVALEMNQLEAFLVNLSQIPQIFGGRLEKVKNYQIGDVVIYFYYIKPHAILCIGIRQEEIDTKKLNKISGNIIALVEDIAKSIKVGSKVNLSNISITVDELIDHLINTQGLYPHSCESSNCPFLNVEMGSSTSLWDKLRQNFKI